MERRVGIIGAGTSGLLACKYLVEKGFHPVVFEAEDGIGGLWRHTIESTKLQNSRESYRFSDFPWDSSVKEENPSSLQVLQYLDSYAQKFGILSHIRFNSKVIDIDYVGEVTEEITESWDLWGGTGKPFGSKGKWHLQVQDTESLSTEVYEVEFVVLCIGKYSGVPNIPKFPAGQGPEVFKGQVIHSMDFSSMANEDAAKLIKSKRVTVIGSQKSAYDVVAECASANGIKQPCTMVQRTVHWFLPDFNIWGINLAFLYFNRFSEFLFHKPGESFFLSLVATLFAPLRWAISKFVESNLRWRLPLDKFGLVPNDSFLQGLSSCQIGILPQNFYDRVKEGSIIIKRSEGFKFCKEGLIIDGDSKPIETDLVILATGFRGDQKLRNIFKSPLFQNHIAPSAKSSVPLYRQILHARIPQVAIIGFAEGLSNLFAFEMRCKWLASFLDGSIELPSVREMEKEVKIWEDSMKLYGGKYYWKSCITNCHIWYNDQLCKDMGCNPRRKKGFFAELFLPYGPTDYMGLSTK
ncbi:probable flavin-containing monooxygenase 1 [Neltuma alba]|uniref:probable flavin-containing monooxygenase 1 n=1 Tax=Neltuma alba TaxID=207710 RepID=UPI0010A3F384|nr:probable flavin-containing monooxygenase 1 [Prosopis alba]